MSDSGKRLSMFTPEERARNLELAKKSREERARIKACIKSGEFPFVEALADERCKKIRVKQLIECVPGMCKCKTDSIMKKLHIAENRRVGGLGIRQREQLIALAENGWK